MVGIVGRVKLLALGKPEAIFLSCSASFDYTAALTLTKGGMLAFTRLTMSSTWSEGWSRLTSVTFFKYISV
jgi:hypothetical protein